MLLPPIRRWLPLVAVSVLLGTSVLPLTTMASPTTMARTAGQLAHSPSVLTWSGWNQVPGGLQTDQAVGMDSAIPSLYGTDMNTHRIYVNDHGSNGWSDHWSEVPGGGTTDRAVAAARYGVNPDVYVFVKGINNHIYWQVHGNSGWKSSWTEVPGGGTTDQALTATWVGGFLYLFAKGMDRKVYLNVLNGTIDPPRWNDSWSEVPGGMLTDTALAAKSWYANNSRLYLFARGQDNAIRFNVFEQSSTGDGSGTWGVWSEVPGLLTNVALAADEFDGGGSDYGHLFLFARRLDDGGIYLNALSQVDLNWSGWSEVPGNGRTQNALGAGDDGLGTFYLCATDLGIGNLTADRNVWCNTVTGSS